MKNTTGPPGRDGVVSADGSARDAWRKLGTCSGCYFTAVYQIISIDVFLMCLYNVLLRVKRLPVKTVIHVKSSPKVVELSRGVLAFSF